MVRKKRKKITNKKELCKMCYKPIEYHASRKQHALCAYLQALKRSEKFSKSHKGIIKPQRKSKIMSQEVINAYYK